MNRGHKFQIGFHFPSLFFKENRQDPPIPQPIPTDTQFVSFWSLVRPSPVWNWTSLIDQDQLWWKRVTTIPSCWTNPCSTTSVPTPAAPPAPVADMHWQQHRFIPSARRRKQQQQQANSQQPTANSPQPTSTAALERTRGESSPRPFGCGLVLVVLVVIWLYSHLCHLPLLSKGTRNSRILARSPASLDHVANQIIPQCKSPALMLMSGTYKTLTTDRGPPYLLMAYSPNK